MFAIYAMSDNKNNNKLKLEYILVLKEFEDIFLEEVPGLPPKRDIDFTIDMISKAFLASKYLYQMNIIDLTEMKSQLQELINKKYIRPSVSLWGALVLFVKKKTKQVKIMHRLLTVK